MKQQSFTTEYLMARVTVEDRGYTTPCWVWKLGRNHEGYGSCGVTPGDAPRKTGSVHRRAYQVIVGPIPEGADLDHLCRVRACANPAHLEPVTKRENTMRSTSFAAANAVKESCVNGHPFDEANTYWRANGTGRDCRTCRAEKNRVYRARRLRVGVASATP